MGIHLPVPVIAEAQPLKLAAHYLDVVVGPFPRIDASFYSCVLSRLAKRIPTDRVEHVKSAQAFVPREGVAGRVISYVAHVEVARRIGQHLERVKFRPAVLNYGLKCRPLSPYSLPFLLDLFCKIFLVHTSDLILNSTAARRQEYYVSG